MRVTRGRYEGYDTNMHLVANAPSWLAALLAHADFLEAVLRDAALDGSLERYRAGYARGVEDAVKAVNRGEEPLPSPG